VTEGADHYQIGSNYKGLIDELRIYNRWLDAEEARNLAGGQALWLRFDEQPGSSQFANSASSSVSVRPCSQASGECPLSGMPGRMDQAGYFNGSSSYLSASGFELKADRPVGFSQAAWIYPTHNDSNPHGILGTLDASNLYPSLSVVNTNELKAAFTTSGGGGCEVTTNSDVVTAFAWNHVAATFDGSSGAYTLYVNGVQVAQANCGAQKPQPGVSRVAIGKVNAQYFRGLLDEVSIFTNKVLTAGEISDLSVEAPKVYLRLDESLLDTSTGITTTVFANTNPEPGYGPGGCALVPQVGDCACPRAGADGWIRKAPVFDVNDVHAGFLQCIKVDTGPATPLSSFSVGGWFKPTKRIGNFDQNLVQSNSFILGITEQMTVTLDIRHSNQGAAPDALLATGRFAEDQWNHVIATYDGVTGEMMIYINGFPQGVATSAKIANNLPIQFAKGFNGLVDELLVYDYVLSPSEIQKMYAYQVRWFDTTDEHKITIDAILPSASLDYALTNIGVVQDQVMAVQASDDASGVARVEYQITGQGAPAGWQQAVQDQEAWVFPITTLQGQYTIQVRAVDNVGNISTPSTKTLTVDNLPPSPTLNSSLIGAVLQPVGDQLALYGSISDASSSVAGLNVALLTQQGVIVGAIQEAQLNGSAWSVDYALPLDANGSYSVRLTAWDSLGNSGVFTPGLVLVDSVAPVADVTFTGASTTTISGPSYMVPTIVGTVDETPYPTNPSLRLHLEEAAGASQFYDSSSYRRVGSCSGACPQAQVAGKAGYAARFSGNQDILVPISSTLDVENTLAVWIRPDWAPTSASIQPAVAGIREGSSQRFSIHLQGDYHGIALWNGANRVTFPAVLTRGQWQHLAVVMAQGQATVYLNGASLGSKNFVPGNAGGLPLHIGSADGTRQFFTGDIDELAFYDRGLSPAQIDTIVHPVSSGVQQVEIGFLHQKDINNPGSIQWSLGSLTDDNAPYSTWLFKPPTGLEGPYHIYLRLTDALGNMRILPSVWQGEIDTEAPRLDYLMRKVDIGGQAWYEVRCRAEDYNLDESSFYCPSNAAAELIYNDEAWFKVYKGQKLFAMQTPSVFINYKVGEMRACDLFGNCRTSTSQPTLFLPWIAMRPGAQIQSAEPIPSQQPSPLGLSLILTPTNSSVFTGLEPLTIAGYTAAASLSRLDLSADGSQVTSLDWTNRQLDRVFWSAEWSPPGEGAYWLDSAAWDAAGNLIPGHPITVYIDLTPPQIGLETQAIGDQEWANGGFILLRGWFEDATGLRRLQVQVEREGAAAGLPEIWQDLPLPDGTSGQWQGYAYTGVPRPPVGEHITISLRAVDVAGRITEITTVLWGDAPAALDWP
jgi:hypothetical protein